MLVCLLVAIMLYTQEGANQECLYNINKFKEIACTNMTLQKQITNEINDTLQPYGPVTDFIEVLELRDCEMSNFAINNLLGFLSQLKEFSVLGSDIMTITFETNYEEKNGKCVSLKKYYNLHNTYITAKHCNSKTTLLRKIIYKQFWKSIKNVRKPMGV